MAQPTTAINRFDLSMTFSEFSNAMNRRRFVGHRIMVPTFVGMQNSDFAKIPIEAVLGKIEETKRGPKGTYARDDFEWDTDSYLTEDHGAEEILDDREVKRYGDILRLERIKRDRAVNRVAIRYEDLAVSAITDTSTLTTTDVVNGSGVGGAKWSNKSSADPLKDLDTAIETVEDNSGMRPNVVGMEKKTFRACMRTDRVENLIKHNGDTSPEGLVAARMALAELLQVDEVVVADAAMKNTADEGQDASLSRIFPTDKVFVGRRAEDDDLESPDPAIGRTLMWREEAGEIPGGEDEHIGILVEDYREDNRRGGVIRARTDYQVKTLHTAAGHLLTNVL